MADSNEAVFERIALTISGGGFRAAAYGLGTLNILHLLGVLENVHMLSTISGGTITGAFYALRRKQGQPVDAIYDDFYKILGADGVLEGAVTKWGEAAGSGGQDYKLIQAFANVYNEELYNKERFDIFWQPDAAGAPFHLQSLIFSATELYTGTAFRFQYASHLPDRVQQNGKIFDSYYIGNGNVTIPRDRARTIRIADIVASSSCFPVGFEPLVLPDDFFPKADLDLVFYTSNGTMVPVKRLGVIDGGVYDNQGIEAIVTANNRNAAYIDNQTGTGYDPTLNPSTLLLIADVASAEKNIYEPPGPGPVAGKSKPLGRIGKTMGTALVILLVVAAVLMLAQLRSYSGGNFFFGLLAGLCLAGAALLFAVRKVWDKLTGTLEQLEPRIFSMALPVLLKFTFSQWGYLLRVRLMVMVKLLLSIFLRRVRSLNYGLVFDDVHTFSPKVVPSILGAFSAMPTILFHPNPAHFAPRAGYFYPLSKQPAKWGPHYGGLAKSAAWTRSSPVPKSPRPIASCCISKRDKRPHPAPCPLSTSRSWTAQP